MMFKIDKILNHNAIIGICEEDKREYLILGKGIAFGRKIGEMAENRKDDTVYVLCEVKKQNEKFRKET